MLYQVNLLQLIERQPTFDNFWFEKPSWRSHMLHTWSYCVCNVGNTPESLSRTTELWMFRLMGAGKQIHLQAVLTKKQHGNRIWYLWYVV